MKIQIRSDSVEIEGYVNAVGRDSRPMRDRSTGERFVEQIVPGAFTRALSRNDVDLLLDHDEKRLLGNTKTNLELTEDSIGLKARATVTDKEVIEKARAGKLRGWSFGFYDRDSRSEEAREGLKRRYVEDMELKEVSIIDDRKLPCYEGTLISTRADELLQGETLEERAEVTEEKEPPKLDSYWNRVNELRKD